MAVLLISQRYHELFAAELAELQGAQPGLSFVLLPTQAPQPGVIQPLSEHPDIGSPLSQHQLEAVTCAFISEDVQFSWPTMLAFVASIKAAPNIRWLQISWIGIDFAFLQPVFAKTQLQVTNAAGSNAKPIAVSVLAAILSLHRGLHHWMQAQVKGEWMDRDRLTPRRDLEGCTVLVYGFGAIGTAVGRMCKAVGLRVLGMRRSPTPVEPDVADDLADSDALSDRIGEADYVVICSPLNDSTKLAFSAQVLARMKPTACLLNVGRGGVVDEGALVAALQEGRIAGAYLDAFTQEPLAADSPLWKLPNVILSPHDAASCVDNAKRVQALFADNLLRFCRGEGLANVVWQSKDTGTSRL